MGSTAPPPPKKVPIPIDVNALQVLGKIFHDRNKSPKGDRANFYQTLLGKEKSMKNTKPHWMKMH